VLRLDVSAWRVVQSQAISFYQKIDNLTTEEAIELNIAIEMTKPLLNLDHELWHELIYTPFRYPLPVGVDFAARFRPPFSLKNIFYCSKEKVTSYAESAHHALWERLHLIEKEDEIIPKTIFGIIINNYENFYLIKSNDPELKIIMSNNYKKSYEIASREDNKDGFIYPSARIKEGTNFAISNIHSLEKDVINQSDCYFKYSVKNEQIIVYEGQSPIISYRNINIFDK
jgi:hypothetical protein